MQIMPIFATWCTGAPYITKWLSGGAATPLATTMAPPLWLPLYGATTDTFLAQSGTINYHIFCEIKK